MYFKLKRGTRRGDLLSVCLFSFALVIVFAMITSNKNVGNSLRISENEFLYTRYKN